VTHQVDLLEGEHTIAILATAAGWNLNWFEITPATTATPTLPPTSALTTLEPTMSPFLSAAPTPAPTPSPTLPPTLAPVTPAPTLSRTCYDGTSELLPARIEAESYCDMSGVQVEGTSDVDGGDNVGYIGTGDWLAFRIKVPNTGTYDVTYRVASLSGNGGFQLEYYGGRSVLGTATTLPSTGGWQNWDSVTHQVDLLEGEHTIAILATAAGWNLNWFEITDAVPTNPTSAPNELYVDPDPARLIWSDEFDVDGLPDSSKWNYDTGGGGYGNNELQHYTNRIENAYVSNGILHVKAVKESYGGNEYTSARLVSKDPARSDWTYGRMLVRSRLLQCTARGTWPAIWMLPTDWCFGGWPDSGEIDIME
jgi:hypothetical protein